MFKYFLLFVLAVCLTSALPSEDEARSLFKEFQMKYDRTYLTEKESEFRFGVFRKTLEKIEQLRAESTGAEYGITKFADLTPREFETQYLTRRDRPYGELETADFTACGAGVRFPELCGVMANSSWDWRNYGAVTPVKDQGSCGSCWSFGTTGDLEGSWFLAGHKLTSLSEQQLVSCDKTDSACNGGLQENAFNYIIKVGGIQSEADYPYTSGKGQVAACQVNTNKFVANMTKWVQVSNSASGESKIADYLVKNGPVTIGINANPMQYYTGGVDNPSNCAEHLLNHAVLIVGYGTDPKAGDYWLIKNSWGTSWGESGYYRIVRGVDKCGLALDVVHSVV